MNKWIYCLQFSSLRNTFNLILAVLSYQQNLGDDMIILAIFVRQAPWPSKRKKKLI